MDTIKKHNEQIQAALSWLAKTKYSSAALLQEAAGRNRRGFVNQLVKQGLCVSRGMAANIKIVGLSEKGSRLVGVKKYDIHKVSDRSVDHHLTVQRELLWMLKNGYELLDYEFEPQSCSHDVRPDIGLTLSDNQPFHVEVELSQKHVARGEMDRFFSKITTYYSMVVFRDPILLSLYIKHAVRYFKEGIPVWEKREGAWCKTNQVESPSEFDWAKTSFKLHLDDQEIQLARLMIEITYKNNSSFIQDLERVNPNEISTFKRFMIDFSS